MQKITVCIVIPQYAKKKSVYFPKKTYNLVWKGPKGKRISSLK